MTDRDTIRQYWDLDAAGYDNVGDHAPRRPAERAAWLAALERLLPPAPARVLDAGAGTGTLSVLAAQLGHQVTAVDLSPQMLARLRAKAASAQVQIDVVEGAAEAPPPGPFDAVLERHLLWTLPDPVGALRAWREVAPAGRLVLLEATWGEGADSVERLRRRGRQLLARLRSEPGHHAEYDVDLLSRLPLGGGPTPDALLEAVASAGWPTPRLHRLADLEWAASLALPLLERPLGVTPRFAVTAG